MADIFKDSVTIYRLLPWVLNFRTLELMCNTHSILTSFSVLLGLNYTIFQYFHHKTTRQVLHLYILPGNIWNVREKRWKCAYFGAVLAFVARILFQSISNEYYLFSMLPFTFHSQFLFFEVWTIPVLFLSIATSKVPWSGWYPLEKALFFKNDPWWFGPFPNTIT